METPRVNVWLAGRLGISRRRADEIIAQGRVLINGAPALLGQRIGQSDHVLVNGQALPDKKASVVVILNKPVGFVSSRKRQGEAPTMYSLLPAKFHRW